VGYVTQSGGWTFRDGRSGRLGVLFAAVWLVFLVDPLQEAWSERSTVSGVVGLLATVGFAVAYLATFSRVRRRRLRLDQRVGLPRAVASVAGLLALAGVMCLTLGQAGTASFVYVAVVGVLLLPTAGAVLLSALLALVNEVAALVVPGWTHQPGLSFAVCAATFAMWGVQQMMLRNADLLRAREENARLAVAEERNRFARDLHDILGHSLTVITVKAELAARLLDVDRERAREEIADLERLSRDALADVRRAVEGYRDLTLPGELARARIALQAAEIAADLPNSTDEVPTELRELFAWTVREGVTNVIRHSGARSCRVLLEPTRVVVYDDGTGAHPDDSGHGLTGLRERAAAAGAVLVTRTLEPHGFALQVAVR
jgi:two-component system sensor histidine kinase DesK